MILTLHNNFHKHPNASVDSIWGRAIIM